MSRLNEIRQESLRQGAKGSDRNEPFSQIEGSEEQPSDSNIGFASWPPIEAKALSELDIAVYDVDGIRFSYPSNWNLQEETLDNDTDIIQVTCPDNSFWMLAVYPGDVEPMEAAKNVLGMMTGEYEDLENLPIKRYFGERILYGYEMNFFYLDLTSTALVLGFREGSQTYIVYWQTCDRMTIAEDTPSSSDVFEAMTSSLLDNLQDADPIYQSILNPSQKIEEFADIEGEMDEENEFGEEIDEETSFEDAKFDNEEDVEDKNV